MLERFYSKVHKTDACWNWLGAVDGRGYGKFVTWNGKKHKYHIASRFSWVITNGPIPPGLFVLHHCDNPICVRPDHLFLGTAKINSQDMKQKGRHAFRVGAANPNAKLSWPDVAIIRKLYKQGISASVLAILYNIAVRTVCNLNNPKQALWTGNRGRTSQERLTAGGMK